MADEGAAQAHMIFRVLQVLTLIPAWALMAAVVDWYNSHTVGAPGMILLLFVGCLLASVWAFCIMIAVQRAGNTALWIAFWDFVAMGVLIGAVAATNNIANYQCTNMSRSPQTIYITPDGQRITAGGDPIEDGDKTDDIWESPDYCGLIKGAWGLAIANIVMFFITGILAIVIYRQNEDAKKQRETVIIEEAPPIVEEKYYPEDDYPRRPRRSSRSHHSRRHSRPRSYIVDDVV